MAGQIAGRVALKLDGPAFLHKTDLGAVVLGLEGAAAVRAAAERLAAVARKASPDRPWRFLVQRMAAPGTELVMGVRTDPVFGPLLAVGLGGIHVEVLRDIRFGLVPATPVTARRLLERLRAFPILKGVRGGTPVDLDKVVDALLRLSALVNEHPEIAEVEMNPVFARPDGVEAVDVRLRVVSR
jgi:acyl-CoA synthetase (NDP forming)